jgi:hypothetical protein
VSYAKLEFRLVQVEIAGRLQTAGQPVKASRVDRFPRISARPVSLCNTSHLSNSSVSKSCELGQPHFESDAADLGSQFQGPWGL